MLAYSEHSMHRYASAEALLVLMSMSLGRAERQMCSQRASFRKSIYGCLHLRNLLIHVHAHGIMV